MALAAAITVVFSGCKSTRQDAGLEQTRPVPDAPPAEKSAATDNLDVFLAELRDAVAQQDMYRLAAMMTPNFGYQLEPLREGDGVFQFWDENNLWGELALIVGEEFVPNGDFMVAPPEFADPSTLYTGYRAGVTKVGGKWKFAYFVRD